MVHGRAGSPWGKGLAIEVKAIDGVSLWPLLPGMPRCPTKDSPEMWEQVWATLDQLSDEELSRLVVSHYDKEKRRVDVTVGWVILSVSPSANSSSSSGADAVWLG